MKCSCLVSSRGGRYVLLASQSVLSPGGYARWRHYNPPGMHDHWGILPLNNTPNVHGLFWSGCYSNMTTADGRFCVMCTYRDAHVSSLCTGEVTSDYVTVMAHSRLCVMCACSCLYTGSNIRLCHGHGTQRVCVVCAYRDAHVSCLYTGSNVRLRHSHGTQRVCVTCAYRDAHVSCLYTGSNVRLRHSHGTQRVCVVGAYRDAHVSCLYTGSNVRLRHSHGTQRVCVMCTYRDALVNCLYTGSNVRLRHGRGTQQEVAVCERGHAGWLPCTWGC